jgi:hypothetical protein
MTVDEAEDALRQLPKAVEVLAVLAAVDVSTFRDGELPYPIPSAGDDFIAEVVTAFQNRLSK